MTHDMAPRDRLRLHLRELQSEVDSSSRVLNWNLIAWHASALVLVARDHVAGPVSPDVVINGATPPAPEPKANPVEALFATTGLNGQPDCVTKLQAALRQPRVRDTRATILDAARAAVTTDRAATHGPAEQTFGMIAGLWSQVLGRPVRPDQVALMLGLLKIGRAWNNPGHMDNWVDLAGYAACGGELAAQARDDWPDAGAGLDQRS